MRSARTVAIATVLGAVALVSGCNTTGPSATPATSPVASAGTTQAATQPASSLASPSTSLPASPAASPGGFAFAANAILGYYQSIGYACTSGVPSPRAPGFTVRTCTYLDTAGRTHDVELVTGASGLLEAAIGRVKSAAGEAILDPSAVFESMSGFAGATLGAEPGAALVPWLAAHLGDAHAETTSGAIRVETFLDSLTDHSAITLALYAPDYLAAVPTPSPVP